jgi:hypothetical protein
MPGNGVKSVVFETFSISGFRCLLYLECNIPYESHRIMRTTTVLCNRVIDVLDDRRSSGIAEIVAQIPLYTRQVRMYSRGLNTLEISSQSSLDRLPQILLGQTQLLVCQLLFSRRLSFPICKQENLQVIPK